MSEAEKTAFLYGIHKILKCSKEGIKIIQSQKMCNVRLIERSSRCVKDPNPLSSTMSAMTQKYPISVRRTQAKKYSLPYEFFPPKPIDDVHRHDRVLCKKEAVDFWAGASPLPSEDETEAIDIIYKPFRDEVKMYYDINWDLTFVKYGPPNFERRIVNTRDPSVKVDRRIRDNLVGVSLFPDMMIPYERYGSDLKQQVKELTQAKVITKMSLPHQIRVLLNAMDSRPRMLPVTPGLQEAEVAFKHAVLGSNLIVTNLNLPTEKLEPTSRMVMRFCKALLYVSRERELTLDQIQDQLRVTRLVETSIRYYVESSEIRDTIEVKWAKACLGIPIGMENIRNGFHTSPLPATVAPAYRTNKSNFKYKIYSGT